MKKEKSCGAVIYKMIDGEMYFLLIRAKNGHHYSFPKGHVEGFETELETALREIKEETNLNVRIDTNYRAMVTYKPIPGVLKDVIYFVATPFGEENLTPQPSEIEICKWLPYEEAVKMTTFEDERNALINARKYLLAKKKDIS